MDAEINAEVDSIELATRLAVPCGIILNELVSNAVRHSGQDRDLVKVDIRARRLGSEVVELVVSDQGQGIVDNPSERQSLGLQLVEGLIANQLDGTHEVTSNGGVRHVIRFKAGE